jgi:hypothetical protein
MASSASVYTALDEVGSRVSGDMSERDIENLFLETGFYRALGYEGTGVDIRSEFTLPDDRRPDYITLDSNEDVIAVYEFKTSGRSLPEHEDQLFDYMEQLRSDYGVLTNGEELRVYQRGENQPTRTISTVSITEQQARDLATTLEKREIDLSKADDVQRFREELDPVPLDERSDFGQEHFFDTSRPEKGSPFAATWPDRFRSDPNQPATRIAATSGA